MRLVIQGKELEFRIQERRIVTCSVFHKGVEIAGDLAICAPQDKFDLREGELTAVTRVADQLFERQQQERKDSMAKVDKVFTEVGALSGNVELPAMEAPRSIIDRVMKKLDDRRVKKAKELSIEMLKATIDAFHKDFPLISGLPFLFSPFMPRERSFFNLGSGILTKRTGK